MAAGPVQVNALTAFNEEMFLRLAQAEGRAAELRYEEELADAAAKAALEQAELNYEENVALAAARALRERGSARKASRAAADNVAYAEELVNISCKELSDAAELENLSVVPEEEEGAAGAERAPVPKAQAPAASAASAAELAAMRAALREAELKASESERRLAAVLAAQALVVAQAQAMALAAQMPGSTATGGLMSASPRTPTRGAEGGARVTGEVPLLNPLTGYRVAGELTQQQVLALTLSRAATEVLRWPPEKTPAVRRTLLAARAVAVKMRLDPDTYTLDSLLRCLKVSPAAAKGPSPSTVAAAEMRKLQLQLHLNGTGAEASAAAEKWLTQMIEPLLVHVMLGGCVAVAEAPPLTVGITGSLNRVADFRMIYGNLEKHVQILETVYLLAGELTVDVVYPLTRVPVATMVGGEIVVDRGARIMALLIAIACLLETVRTVGTPRSYREEMKAAAAAAGAGFPWALGPLFTRTLAGAAIAAHRMEQACVRPPEGVTAWALMTQVGHPLLAVDVSDRLVARLVAHSAIPEGIPQEESAEWRLWRVWNKLMEVRERQALGADEGRTEKETMSLLLGALGFGELITLLQWAATHLFLSRADDADVAVLRKEREERQLEVAPAVGPPVKVVNECPRWRRP